MFTDNNDEFLRNFTPQQEQFNQQVFTPISVPVYTSNVKFTERLAQKTGQKNIYRTKYSQNKGDYLIKPQENHRIRKYSQENIQIQSQKPNGQSSLSVKSQASLSEEECVVNVVEHVQKSSKSLAAKTYKFDICEVEGAFMKKIRNLEVRIKNMSLNYQTLLVKLKKQSSEAQKQNKLIKQYLKQNHPNILQQVLDHATNLSESSKSSFGDSSSNKNNDEWMSIMSKIQQIKFDGQKMSETIKNYQQNLLKKQQVQEQLNHQQNKQEILKNQQQQKRKTLLRKYSIPINIPRIKKQSFQTTMITELKQQELKTGAVMNRMKIS